jgi:carbonic anhydrase/acetyltransferase-like protein (isoleucine patch superfamily)
MDDFSLMKPEINPRSFIASQAVVLGRVVLHEGASIWFNAVVRADLAEIIIGRNSNVQDNCVIHVENNEGTYIGEGVTIGHGAVLHACKVGDNCLIGMGAIILDGARIAPNSLVAAGSVVPPGKSYPEGSLIMGSPAVVRRALTPEEIQQNKASALRYRRYWESYLQSGVHLFHPREGIVLMKKP